MYAQDFAPDGEPRGDEAKIDVDGVVDLYESYIIPLTREVEVCLILSLGFIFWEVDVFELGRLSACPSKWTLQRSHRRSRSGEETTKACSK